MKRTRILALLIVAGCSSSKSPAASGDDAGAIANPTSPPDPAAVAHGEYLVKSVAACGECHTPRNAAGNLDMSRWLAGVANRFDVMPDDDAVGAIAAPNITPAGIGDWSDAAIKRAMLDGVGNTNEPLYPVMPYYVFHNMSREDADAIVAYLRTVPAIANDTPARQPLPSPLRAPASPVPDSAIPHTTLKATDPNYKHAEHGRYLAAQVGFCMDCHTGWRVGADQPLDTTALFVGGRGFSAKDWAVPAPAPRLLVSYNITPDESGIKGGTPDTMKTLLKKGLDDQGKPICRPMPSGPMGAYGGLTDADALDIGFYVTTLPPIASSEVPQCPAP